MGAFKMTDSPMASRAREADKVLGADVAHEERHPHRKPVHVPARQEVLVLAARAGGLARTRRAGDRRLCLLFRPKRAKANGQNLGETGPLSQGVQEGRQALRILHIHALHGIDDRE